MTIVRGIDRPCLGTPCRQNGKIPARQQVRRLSNHEALGSDPHAVSAAKEREPTGCDPIPGGRLQEPYSTRLRPLLSGGFPAARFLLASRGPAPWRKDTA